MKKWWIFPTVVAVAVSGAALTLGKGDVPETVPTVCLTPRRVEQTVTCNGVVEAGDRRGVSAEVGCVISRIAVREGQTVRAGDALATVDKTATKERQSMRGRSVDALTLTAMPETLTAPTAGVVAQIHTAAGEWLEAGEPCVTLVPFSGLQIRVAVKEKNLRDLRVGMTARVKGDGFTRSTYTGRLTEIASTARTSSATGQTVVEAVIALDEDEADESLRLGLSAKATIVTAVTEDALVIPYAALAEDADGEKSVFIVRGGVAIRHPIAVRTELSDGVLTENAELAGEYVITAPERVHDGMAVVADTGEAT